MAAMANSSWMHSGNNSIELSNFLRATYFPGDAYFTVYPTRRRRSQRYPIIAIDRCHFRVSSLKESRPSTKQRCYFMPGRSAQACLDTHHIAFQLKNYHSLSTGLEIHSLIVIHGREQETYFGNLLISMYFKCGALDHTQWVFASLHVRNVVTWNAMIAAYADHELDHQAFGLYQHMLGLGVNPTEITFISVLGACSCHKMLACGRKIHADIIERGFDSVIVVANALLSMYDRCADIASACLVFEKMHLRNVVSWTAIIGACSDHGYGNKAIALLKQMADRGVEIDHVAAISILTACASTRNLAEGQAIHNCITSGLYELDVVMGNALITLYGNCGALVEAINVFNHLKHRNLITWTAMIMAYLQQGCAREAFELLEQMEHQGLQPDKITLSKILGAFEGIEGLGDGIHVYVRVLERGIELDVVLGTALVSMYSKCGALQSACVVFNKMDEHNVISWNALLGAHSLHNTCKETCDVFHQMVQLGEEPDEITFIIVLNVLASPAVLHKGRDVHSRIIQAGLGAGDVANALLNMYGKCGDLEAAIRVFNRISQHTLIHWNTMLATYSKHGCSRHVLSLYRQMEKTGTMPDTVTFICLLSACSHVGLVTEGHCLFSSMTEKYLISPTLGHYTCMVDLLGRAGQLQEAENMINNMPYHPDVKMWMTFLAACKMHRDLERGKRVAKYILHLDPTIPSVYVSLSDMPKLSITIASGA